MQRMVAIAVVILMSPGAAVAQIGKAEQEVRTFLAAYDKAVAGRDIVFLERAYPEDFVFTGSSGRMSNRAEVLKFFTRERDKPSYRMSSLRHENVVVRVSGNMAVVTNDYTSQTTPVDSPDAEPDTYTGRHTGVFEKRAGRWMVIAEQDTEQPHDDKLMERKVQAAARTYAELEKTGDITALGGMLDDDYTGTSRDGEILDKARMLERARTSQAKLESAELSEQTVRAIDNGTAVETGKVRHVGTRAGSRFDVATRYTRTWVLRDRWQITASHSSLISAP